MASYTSPTSDEAFCKDGSARPAAKALLNYLNQLSGHELAARARAADLSIKQMGVTFTVYSEDCNIDRDWPFDIIPRVIDSKEWTKIKGLVKKICGWF